MAETNVRIIDELKKFIRAIVNNPIEKAQYCNSSKAFTRDRILTMENTIMLIMNALKRSLNIELQSYFDHFGENKSCSKQAFCEQRVKLKPEFFHAWNQVLVSSFYKHYGDTVKTWKGMVLWAIDGSSVPLPETEDLWDLFGGASNQTGEKVSTTARVCCVYDVLNAIIIKGFLHSYFVSEEEVIPPCLSELEMEKKLFLFDRGYPSYWLMYLLMEKGSRFVMRVQRNANNMVRDFLASEATDITIEWAPPSTSLKKLRDMGRAISKDTLIRVRMVKVVLDTGETEVLITNLYETDVYGEEELREVYHLRWGIETCYGYLKQELQLGQFSGIRPICIEQDFAANLFLFNLQSLIEKQTEAYVEAVGKKRKYRYKINKNSSWALLKDRAVHLFLQEDSRKVLVELEKLFEIYLEPIRPARKYPRIKKRKPNVKYYTLTNYKRAL
ncbi:MAG: IS4 family transposase [Dysgonamonadaceae bacterium]|nr:IS4 family transposase [Dysgonamonadaceae bacterium]